MDCFSVKGDQFFINCDELPRENRFEILSSLVYPPEVTSLYIYSTKDDILDLRGLHLNGLTSMEAMFYRCEAKKILGLENLDTSNITNMDGVFYNCINLEDISFIYNWNVSNVSNISRICFGCKSLKDVFPLCVFNGDKVKDKVDLL